MLEAVSNREAAAVQSAIAYTVRGTIRTSGRLAAHVQYLTEHYVLTEFERTLSLYAPRLGGRFVVDRRAKQLHPMDESRRHAQVEHLQAFIGSIIVQRPDDLVDLDGFACRLYRLRNRDGRLTITAEAYCTRCPGVERTALHDERAFEAKLHPFTLPLERSEVVVRSSMRTRASGTEQENSYALASITPTIDGLAALDRILHYPVAPKTPR